MTDELIDKYIVPFYLKPDLLGKENKPVLTELLKLSNLDSVLKDFLTETGWRNRVVASTIIGGMKMEEYIDQIFFQAKEFSEFHQAKSYAFALTNMDSRKADEYLGVLARTELDSGYSKNLQKYYKAGFSIRNKQYESQMELTDKISELNLRMEKWRNSA